MRAITLAILLALNLLALASILGWLGEPGVSGEPQRLALQLNPERIVLENKQALASTDSGPPASAEKAPGEAPPQPTLSALADGSDRAVSPAVPTADSLPPTPSPSPTPTPATAEPAPLCLAWAGLGSVEANRLGAALRRAGAKISSNSTNVPSSWWVHIPPQSSREQADRQVQHLRSRGVKEFFIVQEAGPNQYAISLGVFKTETRARVLLNQLRKQGVSQAELSPRLSTSHRIEAVFPPAAQPAIDAAARAFSAERSTCASE